MTDVSDNNDEIAMKLNFLRINLFLHLKYDCLAYLILSGFKHFNLLDKWKSFYLF